MPPAAAVSAKYQLSYTVGGAIVARQNSLVGDGSLKVQMEHYFAQVLPASHLPALGGGELSIDIRKIEFVILDSMEWSDALLERDLNWTVTAARLTRLIQTLDEAMELDWTPVDGIDQLRIGLSASIRTLPLADRMLDVGDVLAYAVVVPATTIHEKMTPLRFGGDKTVVVDYKMSQVDGYSAARRADVDGSFVETAAALLDAAGDDLDSKPLAVQAAKMAAFFCGSQADRDSLRLYIPGAQYGAEVQRRSADTASARFLPLLRNAWDLGLNGNFAPLKLCFIQACTGNEFVRLATALATHAKLPTPLVDATCTVLCEMMTPQIMAELDTAALRMATNEVRGAAVGRALGRSPTSSGATLNEEDVEAERKMRASATYAQLVTQLEAENVQPPDYARVLKILCGSAKGRVYLVTGKAAAQIMKTFSAARMGAEYAKAMNAFVAVDLDGNPLTTGCITPVVATHVVHGRFGSEHVKLWEHVCRPIIAARDGRHVASRLDSDESFWTSYARLAVCQPILERFFDFIGYGGKRKGEFRSWLDAIVGHCRTISNLPASLLSKPGLTRGLAMIGKSTVDAAASRDVTMLRELPAIAEIPTAFLQVGSVEDQHLTTLEAGLGDAMQKVRIRDMFDDSAFNDDDDFASSSRRGRHQDGGAGDWGKDSRGRSRWQGQEAWEEDGSWAKKQKVLRAPGDMLSRWGCHMCAEGLIFGARYCVNVTPNGFPAGSESSCLGSVSYSKSVDKRAEWCNMNCTGPHHRPTGVQESDVKVIDLISKQLSAADAATALRVTSTSSSWRLLAGVDERSKVMGALVAGGGGGSPASGAGRDAAKGKGGKGGGKGTKGNPVAKGKGKGKGKGAHFQRQY